MKLSLRNIKKMTPRIARAETPMALTALVTHLLAEKRFNFSDKLQ
jgi:hypothetical protein